MLTVHHLENSRSQRVLWLLEELGVEYRIERYERDPDTLLAPDSLREVHPLGKSPVVVDGERTLAESGAILEYLCERYDGAHAVSPPRGSEDYLRFRYWLHYAEGSAMPPMLLALVCRRMRNAPMPFFAKPVARKIADKLMSSFVGPQLKLHLDWMERTLAEQAWFAGERFSAADIQMSFPIEAAAARIGLESRPKLRAFLECIHERPGYRRALDRAGGFEMPG